MSKEEIIKNAILRDYKSLREFCLEIDFPYSTLQNMLKRGIDRAGTSNVLIICRKLGIDLETLYDLKPFGENKSAGDQSYFSGGDLNLKSAVPTENLNEAGMLTLQKLAQFISEQPEYNLYDGGPRKAHTPVEAAKNEPRSIRDYTMPMAAGYATPINGQDFFLLPVDENMPQDADYSVVINDKSMEPYIMEGERLFVQRDVALEDFDLGIFYHDGKVYFKQICMDTFGNINLLSANADFQDTNFRVKRDRFNTLVCLGKVILPQKLPQPRYG